MKYAIKTDLHDAVNVYCLNKLPHRAYFVPFGSKEEADKVDYIQERYNSGKVKILSGEWEFKYFHSSKHVGAIFDTEMVEFDIVRVPSTWQRTGYEKPWYLNTRYQFKMRPPYINNDVPMAIYRNSFFVANTDNKKFALSFLGVCSNASVYINGAFVGYCEGSHNLNEFDVTTFLNSGNNEVVVAVHKWCNGSYLECQDMFRENGIFRDVYISERELTDIYDYDIKTIKQSNAKYQFNLSVNVTNPVNSATVLVELLDGDNTVVASAVSNTEEWTNFSFEDLVVDEWSAEIPALYNYRITLKNSGDVVTFIRGFVGFKVVEIKGEVFTVNGKAVKLLGVNHHDTDAKKGWVMTLEELERDVKVMKEYNCNTVRMSHYPPDPTLISICDVYGLYVVDEADIECHNVYCNPLNQRFGRISNNLIWKDQFIDRVDNMYKRDRNHASIIMWSLGNEAGGYKCHDEAYNYLKAFNTVPIHYEGVIHTERHSYDVISQMYPHVPRVTAIGEKTLDPQYEGKPYFLCEYAHAMGVGPGAIDEYVKLFYKYDNLMGGCIWEFADHAVLNEKASVKYTYGGDHNEPKHDGNFCVDGLFHPDRSPSSGALNMKAVYRPIRAELVDGNVYKFTNYLSFKNASYLTLKWCLMRNGIESNSGELVLDIAPNTSIDKVIECGDMDGDVDYNMVFTYVDCNNLEVAREQIILQESQYLVNINNTNKNINVIDCEGIYTITCDNIKFEYNTNNGAINSYSLDGVELINQSPYGEHKGLTPGINRAELDNDRFVKIGWNILGYNKSFAKFKSANVDNQGNEITINAQYSIIGITPIAKCNVIYTIHSNGVIDVSIAMSKALKMLFYSDIPRCGISLEMPNEFNNIEYYGYGDRENLADMSEHAILNVFNSKIDGMEEFYIKPQDNGNHIETRYAKVTRDDGTGLQIVHKGKYFNFRAKKYTLKGIVNATHTEEIIKQDTTCLYIDGFYRGTGSQSCGPQPLAKYRPNLKKPLKFEFTLIPIK